MAFSSRPFLPEKSSVNKSPLNPNKPSSHAKFHKQHHTNTNPNAQPNECEQKENHGSQRRRTRFLYSPTAVSGKSSFQSPKGIKSISPAVRPPMIRFSPKKILGERNNLHPTEHRLAEDETLLEKNRFRLCSSAADSAMISMHMDGTQKKRKEEVAKEEQLGFVNAVSPGSPRRQHFADDSDENNSLKEMISGTEVDDLSTVTEDYSLNRWSTQLVDFLCETDIANKGNNRPTQSLKHETGELKHGDDHLHSRSSLELTESCGSAAAALDSTICLRNELTPERSQKSETEVSSKILVEGACEAVFVGSQKSKILVEGACEAVFVGSSEAKEKAQIEVLEVKFDDHPHSTAKSRVFYAKVFGLLCFAAMFLLTCRSPELLSRFVHQTNSCSEQMRTLLKGTQGLWTEGQLTHSHYPDFQDFSLQKNVETAVAVMKKHLQSSEISSKLISNWRLLNKEVIGHFNVESSQTGVKQLWRYIISKLYKDLVARRLAEHAKVQTVMVAIEPMTTQMGKMYKSLMIRLVAIMTQLEEVSMSLTKELLPITEFQNFQASAKKWKEASVHFVPSLLKSLHCDSLLSMLHSKYNALTRIIVETLHAKKLVLIEAVTRKPARAEEEDVLLRNVEEWDWFSEYDIPGDEYLDSPEDREKAMAAYTDLPQLNELLSTILYGESEEINARYLELLHKIDSDASIYAVEDAELPLKSLIESKQPAGEALPRENNQCHTETWKQELLSVCTISNRIDLTMDAPIYEVFSTYQSTDNGDDKMLISMQNEVDDSKIKAEEVVVNAAANDLPGFDLHHQSADSRGKTFFAMDSNIQSLGSAVNISHAIYVLTILAFILLAYYIYSYYINLPKAKTYGHSSKEKGESTNWKEMKMQTPKPKKLETLKSDGPGGFSTPECLKAKNLEEAFITSPENCVGSPFGSFTSYKRTIVSEGQEQEQIKLTPVRRSSRIRNQTTI